MGNTFGKVFRISTYGESHGKSIGVIIDGCPPGIKIDKKHIQDELERRKPGQSKITTPRKEDDSVEILSGIFQDKTTGAPISLQIKNKDQKSSDYKHISDTFRPSHADYTYFKKYGNRDHRGGGRSSARETANWVAAGAIAKQILKNLDIKINAYVSQVGNIKLTKHYSDLDFKNTEKNIVRCPDDEYAKMFIDLIDKTRKTLTLLAELSHVSFRVALLELESQSLINFTRNLVELCFQLMQLKDLNMEVVFMAHQ